MDIPIYGNFLKLDMSNPSHYYGRKFTILRKDPTNGVRPGKTDLRRET